MDKIRNFFFRGGKAKQPGVGIWKRSVESTLRYRQHSSEQYSTPPNDTNKTRTLISTTTSRKRVKSMLCTLQAHNIDRAHHTSKHHLPSTARHQCQFNNSDTLSIVSPLPVSPPHSTDAATHTTVTPEQQPPRTVFQ